MNQELYATIIFIAAIVFMIAVVRSSSTISSFPKFESTLPKPQRSNCLMYSVSGLNKEMKYHDFRFEFTTGHNNYYECRYCKKRAVIVGNGGYQPINIEWINANSGEKLVIDDEAKAK